MNITQLKSPTEAFKTHPKTTPSIHVLVFLYRTFRWELFHTAICFVFLSSVIFALFTLYINPSPLQTVPRGPTDTQEHVHTVLLATCTLSEYFMGHKQPHNRTLWVFVTSFKTVHLSLTRSTCKRLHNLDKYNCCLVEPCVSSNVNLENSHVFRWITMRMRLASQTSEASQGPAEFSPLFELQKIVQTEILG